MSSMIAMFAEAYVKTWPVCLVFLAFFTVVASIAYWLRAERFDFTVPPRPAFWCCLVPGFVLMAVCLTLVDKPHFAISEVDKDWLFMFSAFLGIPVALPMLMGAIWAAAHRLVRAPLKASSFALVMLGSFAIGCATSNIHDVVWCGTYTGAFTHHVKAGYDLDYFVAFGGYFGITRDVLADYATLGPCALVLVLGELLVAAACFVRLSRADGGAPEGRRG